MKCKHCKNEIPDELHFTFCGYCGERLVRERRKKGEISIPTPRKRGQKWYVDLRREGVTVIEDTEAEAKAKAIAIRAGFIEAKAKLPAITLQQAIDDYINDRDNVLSPATIRGYNSIRNNRFKSVSSDDIFKVNWQAAINAEAKLCSAKTLSNAWGFVKTVLRQNGFVPPSVTLPQEIKKELPWLDYNQIQVFLAAVRGEPCEIAALLALHSLRRSELLDITPNKISNGIIHVSGSKVFNKDNKLVEKSTNKNSKSRRDIRIVIPRLIDLIETSDVNPDEPFVSCYANTVWAQINKVCEKADLPPVGVHGLRRSFASLAYHLGWSERQTMKTGGWADFKTVHSIYVKLSDADEQKDVQKMLNYYENTANFTTTAKFP